MADRQDQSQGPGVQRFEGKVGVVTGAASGMGRDSALRLAREGAAVVVAALPDDERAAETVALIEAEGGQSLAVPIDVTREADNDAMAQAAVDAFGRLDYCIAAAGISHAGYVSGEVTEGEPLLGGAHRHVVHKPVEYWEKVLAVNLTGVMLTKPRRGATDDRARQRRGDREHLVGRGESADPRHGRLLRVQGRRLDADPLPRAGTRAQPHSREHCRAGAD